MEAIHLTNAVLCASCDCITESKHESCAVCGASGSLLALSQVLNRGLSRTAAKCPPQSSLASLEAIRELLGITSVNGLRLNKILATGPC